MTSRAIHIRQVLDAVGTRTLPSREYEILRLRAERKTLNEIADLTGYSKLRISQLAKHAELRCHGLLVDTPAGVYLYERFGE